MEYPEDLRYTAEHEWVRVEDGRARIGITDYAQDALGDIVYVDLPQVGAAVDAGQAFCEVESTKSVSDVYAPVAGTVVEVNESLADAPQRINDAPYGDGWICVIEMTDQGAADGLLDAAAYQALLAED
jgi:glycine cleavage system H protein